MKNTPHDIGIDSHMTEDFYDLLEIPSDASQDDVKEAYREQVRVYHPDLNDDDRAQAQFTAVKTAYDILGDPVERQAYDRLGHEDYVAKRTSGLPSPDVWKSSDESSTAETDDGSTDTGSSSRTKQSTRSTSTATGSTATGSTSTTTGSTTTGSGSASSTATGSGSNTTTGRTASTSTTGATSSGSATTTSGTTDSVGSTDGGTVHGTGASTTSEPSRFGDNALVQWWRRQNVAWPLIWLSLLTYIAGLAHYAIENADGLGLLWAESTAIGAEPETLWEAVSTQRYGIQSPIEFVMAVELVAPPLPPTEWYGVLAGVVALALVAVCLNRVLWRSNTTGSVTIDETIIVALALGLVTVLLGGPLLAGAALMPVLFGVVVSSTRRLPGWSPSYLYVLAVLAPAVGFAAGVAGVVSLPAELLLFVVVPLIGALGLPIRATIRKRFGR